MSHNSRRIVAATIEANALRRAREKTGMTVAEFAAILDMSPSTIYRTENGRRPPNTALMGVWLQVCERVKTPPPSA